MEMNLLVYTDLGEALNSICALAGSVTILTRTTEESIGELLTLDQRGEIKE